MKNFTTRIITHFRTAPSLATSLLAALLLLCAHPGAARLPEEAMKLAREAEKQAQSGKMEDAVRILQGIDKRYPKEPAISLRLAQLYDTAGRNGPALFYYRRYMTYAGAASREDIRLRVYGLELVAGSKTGAEEYGRKLGEETAVVAVPTPVERTESFMGKDAIAAKERMRAAAEAAAAGRGAAVEISDTPAPGSNKAAPDARPAASSAAAPSDPAPAIPRTSRNVPADTSAAPSSRANSPLVISNETLAASGAMSAPPASAPVSPMVPAPSASMPPPAPSGSAIADGAPMVPLTSPGASAIVPPNPNEFRAAASGETPPAPDSNGIRSVNRRGIQIGASNSAPRAPSDTARSAAPTPSDFTSDGSASRIAPGASNSRLIDGDAPMRTSEPDFFRAAPSNNAASATLSVTNDLQNSLLTIVAIPAGGGKPTNLILAPTESRRVELAPGDYSMRISHTETSYPPKRRLEKRFDARLRGGTEYTRSFNGE